MNIRRYISCVLLLFVCFYVLFLPLHTVYAQDNEEISTFFGKEYPIIYESSGVSTFALDGSYSINGFGVETIYKDINNDNWNLGLNDLDLTDSEVYFNNDGRVLFWFRLDMPESIPKGQVVDVELKFNHAPGTLEYYHVATQNSNWESIGCSYTGKITSSSNTSCNFLISDMSSSQGAIDKMYIYFYYTPTPGTSVFNTEVLRVTVTEVSSNGLLSNIIQIIRDIWNGIINLPSNIANAVKGFFDNVVNAVKGIGTSIVNALTTLGNFIIDGIKGLFVPSEQDITNMKDKWDSLLSDRFGALYQVAGLISDYAGAFTNQSKNTITFPSVSIPLAGANFQFGGWEVKIVPDGFGIIFETLKLITSILATILFVNGLRNRFDKIMGGASDI